MNNICRKFPKILVGFLLILCTSSCIYCFGNGVPYLSCGEAICVPADSLIIAETLNEARVEAGQKCLSINQYLNETAQNHAEYISLNDGVLTHDEIKNNPGFTGETWVLRIRGSDYQGSPATEFLAMGYSAEQVANMWLLSTDHAQYLMTPGIGDIGIGFSENIWVVNLGIP